MGVITTENIESGVLFGPIPPRLAITDPILLIGHMTADNMPDLHTVKMNINNKSSVSALIDWIPYVRAARHTAEQNLEALLDDTQLYYRSIKPISMGSELLVWYTPTLAKMLGVVEIQPTFIINDIYTCPYCCKEFSYPFSLRAHMRFKCEQNPFLPKPTKFNTTNLPLNLTTPGFIPKVKDGFLENNVSPKNSSGASSGSDVSPSSSPIQSEKRAIKRKNNESELTDPLNLVKREATEPVPYTVEHLSQSLSPHQKSNVSIEDATCIEKTIAVTSEMGDSASAFHKVTKASQHSQREKDRLVMYAHPLVPVLAPPASTHIRFSNQLPSQIVANLHDMQMNMAMRQAAKENIPQAIAPMQGMALKNREDLRNLINCGKLPFHPDWRFQFPYIKSQNPIVDNLLTSAATLTVPAPLTQNWCAKCNATFRMTSDLVYHMRSHHKDEFQKTNAKPLEKLRCDVCGDRFKERHHLTRHMTSHQEV